MALVRKTKLYTSMFTSWQCVLILINAGESLLFAEHRLWVHPHAQHDECSEERYPSEVNIWN